MTQDPRSPEQRGKVTIRDKRAATNEGAPAVADVHATEDPRVAEAESLAEERKDQLLRLKADFENYRKRVIREQTDIVERASQRIVEQLLPVLDDLERALDAAKSSGETDGLVRGVEIVAKQLHDVLASEGIERIEASGADFDPNDHEAVSSVPGDVEHATVLEVVRPGYRLKGRTIRPALVSVAVPGPAAEVREEA